MNEREYNLGLTEMGKNMSFSELLKRVETDEIYEDIENVFGVDGSGVNEFLSTHEVSPIAIDYDENGSDIDDEEIIDARTKHNELETFENESRDELAKLGDILQTKNLTYDIDSDYDNEANFESPIESSEEDEYGYLTVPTTRRIKQPFQSANVDDINCNDKTFFLGQTFANVVELREKMIDYCAKNGLNTTYTKNSKERVGVKCSEENCEWKLWASIEKNKKHLKVKTYNGVLSCGRKNKVKKITYMWIARHYLKKFKTNPYLKLQEIIDSIWSDLGLKVSLHMAFRAKKFALNLIVGEYKEQYALLNNYAAEILRSDRKNTVKFQLENNVFRRMYICFAAVREGFLARFQPFIWIDGCWLKGPYGGQLLVTVGRDGNNQMYPISWAVVETENTDSWSWFLMLLAEDLRTSDGASYSIMSDQQKGLLKAVGDMWTQAEQRVCVRHVYMNFRQVFGGGQEYTMQFWRIAKSTTLNEFKKNIDHMSSICKEAATDLMGRNYKKWCRAFYTPRSQCDAVDNNMSEVFNAYILNSRHKPIITMLEDIRESIMERLHKKRDFMSSKNLVICPRAQEQLEKAKIAARGWNSYFGGTFTFGVRGATQVRYVVDLLNRTCSCNAWQLSGIPCNHTVAAIWHNNERPEAYIADCYKKVTYLKAYDYFMEPLNGAREWPSSEQPSIIAPILKKVKAGRPKKARKPGPGENMSNATKKSKVGTTCHCSICGLPGHNVRGCKVPQTKEGGLQNKRASTSKKSSQNLEPFEYPSQGQQPAPPMHQRGLGMYTYPNGFQRVGNINNRSSMT